MPVEDCGSLNAEHPQVVKKIIKDSRYQAGIFSFCRCGVGKGSGKLYFSREGKQRSVRNRGFLNAEHSSLEQEITLKTPRNLRGVFVFCGEMPIFSLIAIL